MKDENEMAYYKYVEREYNYKLAHIDEIIKNPSNPVKFTYTMDQLKDVVNKPINNENNNEYIKYVIDELNEFYELEDKNNLLKIEEILFAIKKFNLYYYSLPIEIKTTIDEIKKHLDYLIDMKLINYYNQQKDINNQQDEMIQEIITNDITNQDAIDESNYKDKYSLTYIDELIMKLKAMPNNDLFQSEKINIMKERFYFKNLGDNYTNEDINRLYKFVSLLKRIEAQILMNNDKTVKLPIDYENEELISIIDVDDNDDLINNKKNTR